MLATTIRIVKHVKFRQIDPIENVFYTRHTFLGTFQKVGCRPNDIATNDKMRLQ